MLDADMEKGSLFWDGAWSAKSPWKGGWYKHMAWSMGTSFIGSDGGGNIINTVTEII